MKEKIDTAKTVSAPDNAQSGSCSMCEGETIHKVANFIATCERCGHSFELHRPREDKSSCSKCDGTGQDRNHVWPDGSYAACQHDELLAALRKIADREWSDETISWRIEAIEMQDEARAAIANVERGAQ